MRLSNKLMQQVSKLSPGHKLELACRMFGCDGTETDNYGQTVLFTNLKVGRDDRVRQMKPSDFDR